VNPNEFIEEGIFRGGCLTDQNNDPSVQKINLNDFVDYL